MCEQHAILRRMKAEERDQIVTELKRAYGMELETVQNYLANWIDLDGVRAEEIKNRSRPISPKS
jgi:bacterioferritin